MMYTGRHMTDRFEICAKLIPLSCDQPETSELVVKESVDTFLVAFLYTRVLIRVRSNANIDVAIIDRDVRMEGLVPPMTAVPPLPAVPRTVDRVRIDEGWW